MSILIDKIEAIAPDQASLAAAVKIKPNSWSVLALDSAEAFAWGECQGSGSTPYRACVHIPDLGYKCTCPSRKFPCKHTLSLMLMLAKSPKAFSTGELPDWVRDWSSRRRTGAGPAAETPKHPKASLGVIPAENDVEPRDEKSEARAAQQRERLKALREESIISGLDELDLWISDQLNRGLSGFIATATPSCRSLAQRMVDAKAPGLASWIDGLPSRLLALSERDRNIGLIEFLGELHLFAQAYRRQEHLPEALRRDVRRMAGWTIDRQTLLEMLDTVRISANWLVTGVHAEVQPDKLRRIETWLLGKQKGIDHACLFLPSESLNWGRTIAAGKFSPGQYTSNTKAQDTISE